MKDKQAVLAAVKTVLSAKIQAGMLYVGFNSDVGNPQYTSGAIWAFEAMLSQLEELDVEALPIKTALDGPSASERANGLWQINSSS
jgi:hypothetical protein